jgi:LysM repeat protein
VASEAPAAAPDPAPANPGEPTHIVKKGENLISIAHHYGTTVSELLKLNKISDERKLQIGQTLILPPPANTAPPAAAPTSPPPKAP